MISLIKLSGVAPGRSSVCNPEHPLHQLVLDLAEQVDQVFQQWLEKSAPDSAIGNPSASDWQEPRHAGDFH